MCPPYLLVSYPELYDLLEGSPLIHDRTILFVEYPKQLSKEVRPGAVLKGSWPGPAITVTYNLCCYLYPGCESVCWA
jgi:hypothetical protein